MVQKIGTETLVLHAHEHTVLGGNEKHFFKRRNVMEIVPKTVFVQKNCMESFSFKTTGCF